MGIMQQAQADIIGILNNANEFGIPITFVTPNGSHTITMNGLGIKHHTTIDENGNMISSKIARATVSEKSFANYLTTQNGDLLTTQNGDYIIDDDSYPIRNNAGEINIIPKGKDKTSVSFKDNMGKLCHYTVRNAYPDESLGVIVCMLDIKK